MKNILLASGSRAEMALSAVGAQMRPTQRGGRFLLATVFSALVLGVVGAQAADYPNKPITIVVPYNPGGASDMTTRVIAQGMEQKLGVPVVVANKAGGAGGVGLEYVSSSKKDGYTLSYMPVESTMIKALGFTDVQPADFTYLGRVMTLPAAITVQADSPWKTIEELLDYASKNPGKVTVGNSGTGSIWHVASASLAEKAGVKFNNVPFDGAAPAIAALLGGHIKAVAVSASEVLPSEKAGTLRVLALMSEKRSPMLPGVPTLKERNIDVEVVGWGGFGVPVGTPPEVVSVLEAAIKSSFETKAFKDFTTERSMEHSYLDSKATNVYAQSQYEYFSKLIPSLGIK
ncbi:MAG: tripartite tricarboxylate transporter substrate binding protein [Castellaniella sp.]|uniref:Bug family tripartite tricarboxylate transporter substrate binding protein n=1 Tax=Castellaniella sp. TaxID=1955812 RepID=UPI003C717D1A